MTRRLRIEWSPGRKVTALLGGPGEGDVGVLLAHGAGAGQRHPFLAGMRRRLGAAGLPTLTFDYPYMEEGRRAPNRMPQLMECHIASYDRLAQRVDRVVIAGKSMGGRIGGHVASRVKAHRLVFYGYPLLPPGGGEPRDTSHLASLRVPMLFFQGAKDRLGSPAALRDAVAGMAAATVEEVDDADHSFRMPVRSGLSADDVLDRLAAATARFVA